MTIPTLEIDSPLLFLWTFPAKRSVLLRPRLAPLFNFSFKRLFPSNSRLFLLSIRSFSLLVFLHPGVNLSALDNSWLATDSLCYGTNPLRSLRRAVVLRDLPSLYLGPPLPRSRRHQAGEFSAHQVPTSTLLRSVTPYGSFSDFLTARSRDLSSLLLLIDTILLPLVPSLHIPPKKCRRRHIDGFGAVFARTLIRRAANPFGFLSGGAEAVSVTAGIRRALSALVSLRLIFRRET